MNSKKILKILLLAAVFFGFFGMHKDSLALTAFPGAQGMGADSVGGRGGAVIKVTNLNDSGAGSLRAALSLSEPRTIVFEVSGNIALDSILSITNPYVTIAGQTSPGGISVSGHQFNVATHDVIIRHMRFRHGGYAYAGNDSDGDSLSLWGPYWNGGTPIYNIIIDHCSVTWGTDETFSVTGGATAVTLSNNIIAQGLNRAKEDYTGIPEQHSKGLMISGKYENNTSVSLYKNYIAHNYDRNPLMLNPTADNTTMMIDATNNIIFNWWHGFRPSFGGDAQVNWIHNYAKEGPDGNATTFFMESEFDSTPPAEQLLYVFGNLDSGVTDTPEWRISQGYGTTPLETTYQKATRWNVSNPLPYATMTSIYSSEIVSGVGATVPIRDLVDTAIVNSYDADANMHIDRVSYPGDWPTYQQLAAPTDGDDDGMPDSYETSNSLNGSLDDSASDIDGDGYTNIEEYFSYLAGDVQSDTTAPAAPSGLSVQ